jgi:hypothetical protein
MPGIRLTTIDRVTRPRPLSVPQFRGIREVGPKSHAVVLDLQGS